MGGENLAHSYYKKILDGDRVNWLGVFRDDKGREFYLGEVKVACVDRNTSFEKSPVYNVNELALIYENTYDRLSYLKQNLPAQMYFW